MSVVLTDAFLRFDSRVTDDDQVINIRDRWVMTRNFNALMARRIQQPIITMGLNSDTDSVSAETFDHGCRPADGGIPAKRYFSSCQIMLPAGCQSCTLTIYGYQTSNTAPDDDVDVLVYPLIEKYGDTPSVASLASVAVNVEAAGVTKITTTVSCPPNHTHDDYLVFSVYVETPERNSLGKGHGAEDTIDAAGRDWVESSTANCSVGQVLRIYDGVGGSVRSDIEPQQIVRIEEGTTGDRYYVDAPWTGAIVAGTDVLNYKTPNNLHLHSLVLYPNAVTDATAWVDR